MFAIATRMTALPVYIRKAPSPPTPITHITARRFSSENVPSATPFSLSFFNNCHAQKIEYIFPHKTEIHDHLKIHTRTSEDLTYYPDLARYLAQSVAGSTLSHDTLHTKVWEILSEQSKRYNISTEKLISMERGLMAALAEKYKA